MKNFQEINRTSIPIGVKKNCKNLIQSLAKTLKIAFLFAMLFTLGVGEMWGDTRKFNTGQKIFFCDRTLTSTMSGKCWKSDGGNVYAYFFNQVGHVGDNDVTNWAESAGKKVYGTDGAAGAIYEFTVPSLPSGGDGSWWGVIFTRGSAPSWSDSKTWNQTTDQYPDELKNLFTINDSKSSSNWTGSWSCMPALVGGMKSSNWDKEKYFFTDYNGEKGIVKLTCTSEETFNFKAWDGAWRGDPSDNDPVSSLSDYGTASAGNNFHFKASESGEYIFQWDKTNHKFWLWEPKARLTKGTYLYFDASNSDADRWRAAAFGARYFYKYYDSGNDLTSGGTVDCTTPITGTWVYYTIVPDDYVGQVMIERKNPSSMDSERWNYTGTCSANTRDTKTQNCMFITESEHNWSDAHNLDWKIYCPPTTSETFADNSTDKISWQDGSNDGSSSAKAIWVKTGTDLKVIASATKVVPDGNMTVKYDFKVNNTSQQNTTTASYSHSASTNNTLYKLSVDAYTNYNLDNTKNSTKHTPDTIYYKALNTYSVTHTLSGVTKASGRSGDDAAAYYVAYDATYTANAGYYLPSDVTVTIGGVTKTKGTDYTWTVTDGTSGTLNILSNKISGNVVVTINGIWRWSVAGSWKVITPGEGDPYWDPDTYTMGNIGLNASSKDTCYVEVSLAANTNYSFDIVDRSSDPYTYHKYGTSSSYMTYGNSTNWVFSKNNSYDCGITTAGAGTYKFAYNITDGKVTVIYPASYQVTAAGNPAAGGTVTPSSATYMSTEVGAEITATPNYSHYFNGWTSNALGTFTNASASTTTFKPVAISTVTAAFPERTAFIEGNFQVYNSTRATRTKTGDSWQDGSTAIKMTYESGSNRYCLHTYSTPEELAEQLNNADAYFYIKTSTSGSSIANDASYHAYASGDAAQALSAYGLSNKRATGSSANNFHFTGSEDGYVILYFNGTLLWYELECALSYYGGEGATGDDPAVRTYYAYDSDQTAADNTYTKTNYTFDHWDTKADDSGTDYAEGATNVAMDAHEVCLHAQWTQTPYTISASTDSGGTVGAASYTAYVATPTAISATPAAGYMFDHWEETGGTSYVTFADSSSASTTITATGAASIKAVFALRWSVAGSWSGSAWDVNAYMLTNIGKNASGDDTCSYSFTTFDDNHTYRFKIVDHVLVNGKMSWYGRNSSDPFEMDYNTAMPWTLGAGGDYDTVCIINTAAAGTYKFEWNIKQHKLTVTYPTSYQITMATNPSTGGSTTTPSGTFWVGTDAFDIVATPNYSHYFGGWTSSNGGSFGDHTAETTTFTATANTTLTASMPEYSVFVEGRFEVLSSSGESITVGGADAVNNSIAVKMDYDATNNRYFRRTYSTPQELAKIGANDAYFFFRTSELPNSLRNGAMYYANKYSTTGDNLLSVAGFENARGTKLGNTSRGFLFTGTEEANVTLYFDGTNVWYETEPVKTFTDGASTGYWNNASNWSPNGVPVITDMVYITKPVTVDIDHAKAKRIILDQNDKTGKLTIQANKGLEVLQTIKRTTDGSNRLATRAEDLILESSSSGNASLIFDNNNSDAATVQMYSKASISGDTWNWQFMGTPFTSANALYSYYGSYLYEWQSDGTWDAVANGGTMSPFTGYCITQSSATTYTMSGTLNSNDDVEINIPNGLEFVMANSWTAPIFVSGFTNTTLPLTDQNIYLFNTGHAESDASSGSAAGTYVAVPIHSAPYTGADLIAPMEGFYVDNRGHDAATITLKYNELVRPQVSRDIIAGPMHAPKRVAAEAEPDVMKIKATGSRYADRVVILAREDFSAGFDNGWDGKNINEPGVAPILYALREDGTKDAVSAIPTYEGTVVGFRQGEDNAYTFSFEYDGDETLYLNDLKDQTSTLIDAEHTYSFTTVADDAEARFIISATPIQKLPTGIGNDANDANDGMVKVRKLIINDQLFIIRAGRMYNAVGSIVK